MNINQHELVHADDAGNGYHGNCKHCGLALVTDLGYTSWAGVPCIDRLITREHDVPADIQKYAKFRGLVFTIDPELGLGYCKPYKNRFFTLNELNKHIENVKKDN